MDKIEYLRKTIKVVRDYPKKGVNFKDVSSLLNDPEAFNYAIDLMAEKAELIEKAGGEVIGFLYLIRQNNFEFTLNKPLYSVLEYLD